jgi:hypothetical protein
MKAKLLAKTESNMNRIAQDLDEGLLGFSIGEKVEKNTYLIRDIYGNHYYQDIVNNIAPWNILNRFLEENKDQMKMFPWLSKRSIGLTNKWFKEFESLVGNNIVILSLPRNPSTEIYIPHKGFGFIDYPHKEPKNFGLCSNEFRNLYHDILKSRYDNGKFNKSLTIH